MYVKPLIFNISRASLHDGPGVRSVVYFKGCNMRCAWCHNPEGLERNKQIPFHRSKCIGCGICASLCKHIKVSGEINRSDCIRCGKCAENCPVGAISLVGEEMSIDEVFEVIVKDKEYYVQSGGGVTISGGECLLYPEFSAELLKRCKAENIHTLIESAFCIPWENIEMVLPFTDLFFVDIKCMNNEIGRAHV